MGVADDQPDPGQATGDQAAQEPGPAGPILGGAQLQAEDLAVPGSVDPGSDQRGGVDYPTLLPDLDAQGVQPHEPIGAGVQGPVAPGRDQLIQLAADSGAWDLDRLVMPMAWAMSSTRRVETPST